MSAVSQGDGGWSPWSTVEVVFTTLAVPPFGLSAPSVQAASESTLTIRLAPPLLDGGQAVTLYRIAWKPVAAVPAVVLATASAPGAVAFDDIAWSDGLFVEPVLTTTAVPLAADTNYTLLFWARNGVGWSSSSPLAFAC